MNFFNIFKGEKPLELRVDLHSHILPEIDDGSKGMDESLEMLRTLVEIGYHKIIITPHIMAHPYNNSTAQIRLKLDQLKGAMAEHSIDVVVEVAAEYMLDSELFARIENKDILTFGENYLLFEISRFAMPPNLSELVHELKIAGYRLVLAHPERYLYFSSPQKTYTQLKQQGVLFQCDIGSFVGMYGKEAQLNAKLLGSLGMVDFLGSDIHTAKQAKMLQAALQKGELNHLTATNTLLNNTLL